MVAVLHALKAWRWFLEGVYFTWLSPTTTLVFGYQLKPTFPAAKFVGLNIFHVSGSTGYIGRARLTLPTAFTATPLSKIRRPTFSRR